MSKPLYAKWIEDNLSIVTKSGDVVPFVLNDIQRSYLENDTTGRDIILKARQMGFSSLILARFTADFLLKPNSQSVVVADNTDNAIALLERVKFYIKSFEEKNNIVIPLKYNSKYELYLEPMNSKYTIGTAENTEFGRSRTITNLHLSEAAFYRHFKKLLLGALQAVVPEGLVVIETTANGFNDFKNYWEDTTSGLTGFAALFYSASRFYDAEFLGIKKQELQEQYVQEYPETDVEAFIASGDMFFNKESLSKYLGMTRNVEGVPSLL